MSDLTDRLRNLATSPVKVLFERTTQVPREEVVREVWRQVGQPSAYGVAIENAIHTVQLDEARALRVYEQAQGVSFVALPNDLIDQVACGYSESRGSMSDPTAQQALRDLRESVRLLLDLAVEG